MAYRARCVFPGRVRLAARAHKRNHAVPGRSRQGKVRRTRGNRGDTMKATQLLHNVGQSIWLDNITRDLLNNGTLKRYIDELSVTGLTSNPTIFDHAIKNSATYDDP